MSDLVGKSLNRYQIVSLLGEGGMGEVYKAHDPFLDRDLAIKVMHPHFARMPNFRERFMQEARTAARLDHPCIVKVHDSGEVNGTLYIVMEFIPGDNLYKILADLRTANRWIVLPEAVQVVRQVCLALDYAHRQGVLHRDIKPDNIMFKPKPYEDLPCHPVLTDLGLVKLTEGLPITQEGISMGTPAYMSPEQALGQPLDARSDVYSLGILLYELAVGRLPFPAKTLSEAIRYHTKEPPPPPHSIRPDLPEALEKVILRALAKDPAQRYPKAVTLAQALQDALLPVTLVSASLTEREKAVSLVTQYQQSLVGARGISVVAEFPQQAAAIGQDRIQVMGLDKTVRMVAIQPHGLTIGRDEDNDVVLDDQKVSRHHARIEIDGLSYRIVDLNSTNGTFVGDAQLLPGVAEVWQPEKPVRIGDTWVRLERGKAIDASTQVSADGTLVDASRAFTGPKSTRIGVNLGASQYSVMPGNAIQVALTVINQGQVVDHFRVSLNGVPFEWLSSPTPEIRLMPGESQSVEITVQPPHIPQSKAGEYPLTLRVASLADPSQVVELKASLTVQPFYQYDLELRPKKHSSVGEGNFIVRVANQSNATLTVQLEGRDPEEGCRYTFTPSPASVPAGQEGLVQLKVSPRSAMVGEQPKPYPFTLTARPLEEPTLVRQAQGEWERQAPSFEISLQPQKQRGGVRGDYSVLLSNRGGADLTVQLEATDPEGGCSYFFNTPQVVVAAGQEGRMPLVVKPKASLPGKLSKTYTFTVVARVAGVTGLTRQATGEWEQLPPTLELTLNPQKQGGSSAGNYTVNARNQGDTQLTLQFSASDPEQGCKYTFKPERIVLPVGQVQNIQLKVQPKNRLKGTESKLYPLTVTARPAEAPAISWQTQAEFEHLPRGQAGAQPRSAWRYLFAWLLLVIGWGLATYLADLVFSALGRNAGVIDLIRNSFVPGEYSITDFAAEAIGWAVFGGIAGIFYGLVTFIPIRFAEPSLPLGQILTLALGWLIAWAAAVPGILGFYPLAFHPRVYSVLAGLIGGFFTGKAAQQIKPKPGGGRIFIIMLSWPIGQIVVWQLINMGYDFGPIYEATRLDLTSVISAAVAGALTFLALGLARKQD